MRFIEIYSETEEFSTFVNTDATADAIVKAINVANLGYDKGYDWWDSFIWEIENLGYNIEIPIIDEKYCMD